VVFLRAVEKYTPYGATRDDAAVLALLAQLAGRAHGDEGGGGGGVIVSLADVKERWHLLTGVAPKTHSAAAMRSAAKSRSNQDH